MSPYALMVASGYREHRQAIDIEQIRKHVSEHRDLIGDWIGYSENKRCSGWYFNADRVEGPYRVGCLPRVSSKPERAFDDPVEACAHFVKSELDSIAS